MSGGFWKRSAAALVVAVVALVGSSVPAFGEEPSPEPSPLPSSSVSSSTDPEPSGPPEDSSPEPSLPVEPEPTASDEPSPSSVYVWTADDQLWLVETGNALVVAVGLLALSGAGCLVLLVRR